MYFTIITASFNQGRFIQECLRSVLRNADHPSLHVEHIIIDAESTDSTAEILHAWAEEIAKKELKNYSFKYLIESDKGMSDGINKGANLASGEWWMWLNSDDYLLPGALEHVSASISAHPKAQVVYGGWIFVDAKGTFLKTMKSIPFDLNMMIHYGCYIGSTACFLKTSETIHENELLNINFKQVMDQEYYVRLGKKGLNFVYLPQLLAAFRLHEDNTSRKHNQASDLIGILKRELQQSEVRAISRFYGINPVRHLVYRNFFETLLWTFYRIKKPVRQYIFHTFGL
ncbi:MAG TPA: glycosyltransferase family 2 protein [Terrimicrobiaceae bacterium]|nr:glycosyltransferase family 2 protein [Terrimicrobiaceae bacterium]